MSGVYWRLAGTLGGGIRGQKGYKGHQGYGGS